MPKKSISPGFMVPICRISGIFADIVCYRRSCLDDKRSVTTKSSFSGIHEQALRRLRIFLVEGGRIVGVVHTQWRGIAFK